MMKNNGTSESDQKDSYEMEFLLGKADEEPDPAVLNNSSEQEVQTEREDLRNVNHVTKAGTSGRNIKGSEVTDGRRKQKNLKGLKPCESKRKNFSLHDYVKKNNAFKVRKLLLQEVNVNAIDGHHYSPLLLAGKNIKHFQKGKVTDYEEIVEMLLESKAKPNAEPPDKEMSALERAASLRSHIATKLLLDKGADPFKLPVTENKNTAVHLAAELAAPKTLEIIFDHLRELSEKPENEEEKENILKKRQELANMENSDGFTPLHLAAKARSRHCVYALIDAGADLGSTGGIDVSALDFLLLHFQNSVQFMEKYFDSKISPHTDYSKNEQFSIMLDFYMLAPFMDGNQMTVVRALVEGKDPTKNMRRTLLCHPLVESFITMKWLSLRPLFIWQLVLYGVFVIFLSSYVILIHLDIDHSDTNIINTTLALKVILIILSFCVALFVLVHFLMMPKYYLRERNMWMNLATGIASAVVAFKGDDCQTENHSNTEDQNNCWVSYLASITVLVSWTKILSLIRRFPKWSAHVHLFLAVCGNLCNIIFVFVWMILGFSLSFFILFRKTDKDVYGNPWKAFVKTVVMMMGEFEYEELFKDQNTEKVFGRFIFLFFLILASIVLLNLTVGYAVRDTQEMLTEGKKRCLKKQVKFLNYTQEEIKNCNYISKRLRKYFLKDVHIPVIISVLGDQKKHYGLMLRSIYGIFNPFIFLYRLLRRFLSFIQCNSRRLPTSSSSVKNNTKCRYKSWSSGLSLALIESLLSIALRNGWDKNKERNNQKLVKDNMEEETEYQKVVKHNKEEETQNRKLLKDIKEEETENRKLLKDKKEEETEEKRVTDANDKQDATSIDIENQ